MRIFKFRVWDGKEMHQIQDYPKLIIQEKGRWFAMNGDELVCNYVKPDAALMQFTGLYDKNGKEIWEGDLLLNHFRNQKLVVYWEEDLVCSHGGGWKYKKLDHDTQMTWMIDSRNIEVIGNLYENPELLSKES